jgi:hypothetical protein
MLYDISPQDFADHVRHAKSYADVGRRCGCEFNRHGVLPGTMFKYIKRKIKHMKLDIAHFYGQKRFSDDVLIQFVSESTCLYQVQNKLTLMTGRIAGTDTLRKRIKGLNLDMSHWKIKKSNTMECHAPGSIASLLN